MPADEAADILDDLDDEKVQQLLGEMQVDASDEVRELMEYADNTVGSLMSTEHLSFNEEMTVDETLKELRELKPEPEAIYYLYVLDNRERLVASVAIRDLVISPPNTKLREIMDRKVIKVYDNDKIDSIAEIISKYNMLAIPVVGVNNKMMGMVIIDDVMFTLLKSRKHRILRDA
jgi:Mg/Co/Ni transporter MgtE